MMLQARRRGRRCRSAPATSTRSARCSRPSTAELRDAASRRRCGSSGDARQGAATTVQVAASWARARRSRRYRVKLGGAHGGGAAARGHAVHRPHRAGAAAPASTVQALDRRGKALAAPSAARRALRARQARRRARRRGRRRPGAAPMRQRDRAAPRVSLAALSSRRRAAAARTITMSGSTPTAALVADLAYFYRHESATRRGSRSSAAGPGPGSPTRRADRRRRPREPRARRRTTRRASCSRRSRSAASAWSPTAPTRSRTSAAPRSRTSSPARADELGAGPGLARAPTRSRRWRSTSAPGARSVFLSMFVDLATPLAYLPRTFATGGADARLRRGHARGARLRRPRVRPPLHAIPYEGVPCTRATIRSGAYPARRPLGFVTRGRPTRRPGGSCAGSAHSRTAPPRDRDALRAYHSWFVGRTIISLIATRRGRVTMYSMLSAMSSASSRSMSLKRSRVAPESRAACGRSARWRPPRARPATRAGGGRRTPGASTR